MSEETLTSTPAASCSDVQVESLPGTAKPGSTYVLFEWPHAWTHDVLDGGTLGEELTEKLKAHLAEYDASLLLIRHPTREGRQIDDHHVYLVFAEDEATEVMHVDGPEALLELDLSGPGKNAAAGATARTKPLLLVCTHAKRDRCCAVKGRSMINKLVQKYPFGHGNDVVWETSHIKGHRFAPTMLLMPWAYSFGRMTFEATDAMLEAALRGEYFVPGNRGRGTLSAPAQAAEEGECMMVSGLSNRQASCAAGVLRKKPGTIPLSQDINVRNRSTAWTASVASWSSSGSPKPAASSPLANRWGSARQPWANAWPGWKKNWECAYSTAARAASP